MDIRQQLINIFNGLNLVEVKGQNVMFLGQCMSQLMQLINTIPDTVQSPVEDIKQEDNTEKDK